MYRDIYIYIERERVAIHIYIYIYNTERERYRYRPPSSSRAWPMPRSWRPGSDTAPSATQVVSPTTAYVPKSARVHIYIYIYIERDSCLTTNTKKQKASHAQGPLVKVPGCTFFPNLFFMCATYKS